jgi:hypothetical protein
MQSEHQIDEARIDEEAGQEPEQPVETFGEARFLEADVETRQDRERRHDKIVRDDQILARREGWELQHGRTLEEHWIMAIP